MLQLFNVDMNSYGTYNIWQIPRSLLVTTNVDPIEFNETVGHSRANSDAESIPKSLCSLFLRSSNSPIERRNGYRYGGFSVAGCFCILWYHPFAENVGFGSDDWNAAHKEQGFLCFKL